MQKIWIKSLCGLAWMGLAAGSASAQWRFGDNFGLQAGISLQFGTHINRVGLVARGYALYDFAQFNLQWGGFYTIRAMGNHEHGWEMHLRAGLVGAWGRRDTLINPFLHELSNQTGRRFAAGYAFNVYLDGMKTSQCTGSFGMQLWDFRLAMENDFLSMIPQDRYRTGSLGLYYWVRATQSQIGLQHASWTGNPYGEGAYWHKGKSNFPARSGYIDMTNAPYGKFSAGILAVEWDQVLPFYGQYAGIGLGIDSERIRNAMQNELIHDSKLLNMGDTDAGQNPHIPMLDDSGGHYHYLPGQKVRKPKPFLQLKTNGMHFY